jgi:hypothetical protein
MAITASIFGIFSNVLVEFQKLSIGIKDSTSKIVAVMTVMANTINGTSMTMQSAWKGPPGSMLRGIAGIGDSIRRLELDPFSDSGKKFKKVGKFIKGFCFHPDTLLLLDNGDYVKMKDIKLGSKLKNGSIVNGLLKLNNLDNKGKIEEKLYSLPNGENKLPILVTGKHLIYYNNKLDFVKNHPDSVITNINTKKLSCLITSDHHITIGNYVFWDWEDTEEMIKDLK